ncbi:YtxH domain-containing protein [Candidatus Roizmanbacteria bacterium]|nr:YtxH domain-containing protein [Candidatus Roizmanbacteria bacterium]
MNNQKKPSRFGLGVFLGTILGGLAAFFLSPKSGEENRETVLKRMQELKKSIEKMEIEKKVKEVWGEVTEDGKKTFLKAKKQLLKRFDELQESWQDFDQKKYAKMVEDAVEDAKSETKLTAEKLMKLKDMFVRDWNKIFGSEKKSQ